MRGEDFAAGYSGRHVVREMKNLGKRRRIRRKENEAIKQLLEIK